MCFEKRKIIIIARMCFEKRKENFKVEDNILTVQKWSTFHDPITKMRREVAVNAKF